MSKFRFTLLLTALLAGFSAVRAEDVRYPANSGVLNIKSAPYNAIGNGVADDTAAFQAALTASAAGNTIYIPNGTYRLTNTLSWPGDGGVNITLQGQSQAGTILRLPDNTSGFTSAASPKVLLDGKGNHTPQRFGNSLRNLTVDTGAGNLGTIAVQYYANNVGVCRDVTIRGSGVIGLEMSHTRANGPNLVKNVTIDGFQTGIRTGYGMESLTFENITLRNQTVLGWFNESAARTANGTNHLAASQILSIRQLNASTLAVTAFKNPSGHVVMIDSTFAGTGGASALPAIENGASGKMLLRNISATGYARALKDGAIDISGSTLGEWVSDAPVSQFPSTGATLNLPIQETPAVPEDDPSTWANIKSFGATDWNAAEGSRFDNDAPAIQAAIDSGAATIFIPAGSYRVLSQINVRANVRRIVGVGGVSSVGAGNNASGVPYQGIVWNIQAGAAPIVILENMSSGYAMDMTGVDNQSARTLVLRDLNIQPPKFTGTGDIFIENVVASYWEFNGQRAWARQINPERDGTHIVNRGGTLWLLGLKTEDLGYVIDASNGAKTEILGGMVYSLDDTTATPMIRNIESQLSFSLCEYLGSYGKPYNTLVEETATGVTNSLTRLNGSSVRYPAVWSQNNDGTTTSTTGVVGSQFVLYCGPSAVSSLTVKGNGNGIPDNALATSLSNHTGFGDVQTGASLIHTYTVSNAGTAAVNFTGTPRIVISGANPGDFSIAQNLPASLASGAEVTFQISFAPTISGNRTAMVSFANDNTPDGSQNFAVGGIGIGPAPDIDFNAAGVSTSLNASATGSAAFNVQNTGLGGLSATPVVPTAYTYATSDQLGGPAYEWIEIASGDNIGTRVTAIEGQDDLRSGTFDLGFNFPFYNGAFNKVRVHTNGYIELTNTATASTASSSFGNSTLPQASSPSANLILPYWDDLYFINTGAETSIYTRAYVKTLGTDTAVVTFSNVSFFGDRTKRMTFQIVMKRSGEIRLNYQFIDNDLSCTVGVQKDSGTAVQALYNTAGTRLKNNFSLRFAPPPVFNGNTWLAALTPGTLEVAAPGNGNLTLPFNAAGLTIGESYFTQVRINSNDTDESPAYLPVTLAVTDSGIPSPVIAANQSATGFLNGAFSYFLQASNSPTSYALASGSLPAGITLDPASGQLSGVPTLAGTYLAGFTATNAFGTSPAVTVSIIVATPSSSYDFNSTQADFNTRFLETVSSGTPAWASAGITATGGVGNSGYLATSSNSQSALYGTPYNWAAGETYTVSTYFKARVSAGTVAAGGGLRIGFTDDNLGTLAGAEYVAAGINSVGDHSQLVVISRQSGTITATGPDLGTLTDNLWYQLTGTFTKSATAGQFNVVVSLKSWGADGITGGTVLGTSATLAATGLSNVYASTGVYAGFNGSTNASGNGVRGIDNFLVQIPQQAQSITFAALPAKTLGDAAFPPGATASSGLTVSYASSNTDVATISGSTVNLVGAGTATITASQAGNLDFLPATAVSRSLTVLAALTSIENFRSASGLAADGSQDLLAPAGDGVAHLLKYAFNMIGGGTGQAVTIATPNSARLAADGSAGLPFGAVENATGKLTITYIRRKPATNPGIGYSVEFSNTLATWAENPAATEIATSLDATFERVTVTDSANTTKRFVHVKITGL
jgi:hypothetical protein